MLAFCGLGGGSKAAAGIDADDPVKPSAARPSVQHITASGRASMQASTRMPMLPSTAAPRPWNEPVRVQYLRSLGVLETVRAACVAKVLDHGNALVVACYNC